MINLQKTVSSLSLDIIDLVLKDLLCVDCALSTCSNVNPTSEAERCKYSVLQVAP